MARILRVSCVLLLAGACGSDPPPSTDDTSTSTGTPDPGTSSGSDGGTTMAVTTMPPPDDTTYGAGCGPNPCAACPPGCESYDLCIASEWSCDCICEATGTTGPDACDSLDVALTLWLEESLNLPMDCGTVGEADDAAAWQAMHDCVVALAAGGSFRASWSTPSAAPAPWGIPARRAASPPSTSSCGTSSPASSPSASAPATSSWPPPTARSRWGRPA